MTTLIICSECHKHNEHILANYKMKYKPFYTCAGNPPVTAAGTLEAFDFKISPFIL